MKKWSYHVSELTQIGRKAERLASCYYDKDAMKSIRHFILLQLDRLGSDCSYADLIACTYLHKSTISCELKALAKDGLAESYGEPGDSIRKRVRLTDAGKKAADQSLADFRAWQDAFLAAVPAEHQEKLLNRLAGFYKALCKPGARQCSVPEGWPLYAQYLISISRLLENQGSESQLEYNQKLILTHLLYCGGECRFKELEKNVLVAQSCIAKQMVKLTESGLTECFTDEIDHRVRHGRLTKAGTSKATLLQKQRFALEERCCEGLEKAERMEYLNDLTAIRNATDELEQRLAAKAK